MLKKNKLNTETLLELRNISKTYSGVTVLSNFNASIKKGDVLCLAGENGAGKSTLIKIISGAIFPSSGDIILEGKNYNRLQPKEAISLGIATIYQDIDLIDNLTVADNIFLGAEIKNKLCFINIREQEKRSDEMLDKFNLRNIRGEQMLSDLSTAQKQCVQIVKSLRNDASILILDEPTVSLGEEESKTLLALVKSLAKMGMAIIYISHFLEEIFKIGSHVTVLKDGVQTYNSLIKESNIQTVVENMIGRDAESFYKRERFELGKDLIEIRDYSNGETVHNVSFSMRSGEIFGLGGLVGAGRTELVRMIYGCDKRLSGALFKNGEEITSNSPRQSIKKGMYMIFEDRKLEGIFWQRSIKENITITKNEEKELINLRAEEAIVNKTVNIFGIKLNNQKDEITSLSGGNQQKTIIARCILKEGDIYIFDEPTKGVDIGAKEDIYEHILSLAKNNKFIIIVSSDMLELISMSDRIGIMREGKLVEIIDSKEIDEAKLINKYLGV